MMIFGGARSIMTAEAATPANGYSGPNKPNNPAPNVKNDFKPTADKAANMTAPKTTESKNSGVADNLASNAKTAPAKTEVADKNPLNVIAYGSTSAPITIIEYASFSCPHCAEFDQVEFPKIKADYIDKGLVRVVFRPFSRNGVDVYAGLLVSCLQPERRGAMIDVLFRQQQSWVPFDVPQDQVKDRLIASLKGYGRSAGLSDQSVDQCLVNPTNQSWLQAVLAQGDKDGVEGTPTFFINGKKTNNMAYEDWQKTLNALLPKTN
jgi:protein-disulfide isomerase